MREDVPHGAADQSGPQGAGLERERAAANRGARPRDDVHHREERAVAVERRRRPANDLDALEHRGIETELLADLRLPEHVVIHAVPVDQQQDAAVVVSRIREPACPDVAEVAIVGHIDAADASQDIGERVIAVPLDFVRSDKGDRCGRFDGGLEPLGGAEHLPGVQLHQILDAQVRKRDLGLRG